MNSVEPIWQPLQESPERHREPGDPPQEHSPQEESSFVNLLEEALGLPLPTEPHPPWPILTDIHPTRPQDPWGRAARLYNVRAMDAQQLAALSLALYEAGAITTLDHLILSASPEDTELPWGSPLLTCDRSDQPLDWIVELKARRQVAWSFHHHKSVGELDRLIGHLERIDALGHGWQARSI